MQNKILSSGLTIERHFAVYVQWYRVLRRHGWRLGAANFVIQIDRRETPYTSCDSEYPHE